MGNLPPWMARNKILPGLSGFVTLEDMRRGYGLEEDMRKSGFDKLDIDNLIPHDVHLNLSEFFDDIENGRHPGHQFLDRGI